MVYQMLGAARQLLSHDLKGKNKVCLLLHRWPRSCHAVGLVVKPLVCMYDNVAPVAISYRFWIWTVSNSSLYHELQPPAQTCPGIEAAATTVTSSPWSNAEDASYYSISIHIIRFERCSRLTRILPQSSAKPSSQGECYVHPKLVTNKNNASFVPLNLHTTWCKYERESPIIVPTPNPGW